MTPKALFRVQINYRHDLIPIKGSQPDDIYFSNLKNAVNALLAAMSLNNWDTSGFNYTAVYRALKEKKNYTKEIRLKGTSFYKISVNKCRVNPQIREIGIMPAPDLE